MKDAAPRPGHGLVKQFGVRSGSREFQFCAIISIDQDPVTLWMTAAIILPGAFKRMVIIDGRQGFTLAQLVDNGFQFSHAKSALFAGAEILLELAGDTERFHAPR
jgi:hypothetical protein